MNEENISFEDLLNTSMEKQNKKLGREVTGKVISISNEGEVYVDIDYKSDGIIPKNEFSFDENENAKDILKPGDTINCKVLKMNDGQGNVLLSCKKERSLEKKKHREDSINSFWENAKVGEKFEGTVSAVSSYGCFVKINEFVSGLLHISEMSWDRDAHSSDLVKVGDKIKVTIKELDKENHRMQLSFDDKGADPWDKLDKKVGDVVKVTIKHLVPFGAFAEVSKGVEGLIHISQISNDRIAKPSDVLKVGQKVNAKIIELDIPNRKMELSIRELIGTSEEYNSEESQNIESEEA